jgi:hypothetical protein
MPHGLYECAVLPWARLYSTLQLCFPLSLFASTLVHVCAMTKRGIDSDSDSDSNSNSDSDYSNDYTDNYRVSYTDECNSAICGIA